MENITELMDADGLKRCLKRISHEILEKNHGTKDLVLVGIKTRGLPLANRIKDFIKDIEGYDVPVCSIDISFYRDDLSKIYDSPLVKKSKIDIDVTDKKVVLVDDVLFTGRTVRAAIDALLDNARPQEIQLAIVIDRGHREIPIRADYVGKNVPTSKEEHITVCLNEIDNKEAVFLVK